jgi:hypothetical protein
MIDKDGALPISEFACVGVTRLRRGASRLEDQAEYAYAS